MMKNSLPYLEKHTFLPSESMPTLLWSRNLEYQKVTLIVSLISLLPLFKKNFRTVPVTTSCALLEQYITQILYLYTISWFLQTSLCLFDNLSMCNYKIK